MNIDEWAAEQCGVEGYEDFGVPYPDYYFIKNGRQYQYLWTIKDPRCQSIFWEEYLLKNPVHSKLEYFDMENGLCCSISMGSKGCFKAYGHDRNEACIIAIYEAQKDE